MIFPFLWSDLLHMNNRCSYFNGVNYDEQEENARFAFNFKKKGLTAASHCRRKYFTQHYYYEFEGHVRASIHVCPHGIN